MWIPPEFLLIAKFPKIAPDFIKISENPRSPRYGHFSILPIPRFFVETETGCRDYVEILLKSGTILGSLGTRKIGQICILVLANFPILPIFVETKIRGRNFAETSLKSGAIF